MGATAGGLPWPDPSASVRLMPAAIRSLAEKTEAQFGALKMYAPATFGGYVQSNGQFSVVYPTEMAPIRTALAQPWHIAPYGPVKCFMANLVSIDTAGRTIWFAICDQAGLLCTPAHMGGPGPPITLTWIAWGGA